MQTVITMVTMNLPGCVPRPQAALTPHILSVHRNIMNNKVFYQHPNLMRALGMHETVMEVMVNVLGGGESKVRGLHGRVSSGRGHRMQAFTTGPPCLLPAGNPLPQDGDKLLPIPLLLLQNQPAEPALHV